MHFPIDLIFSPAMAASPFKRAVVVRATYSESLRAGTVRKGYFLD